MSLCSLCLGIPANLFSFKSNEQCHYEHQPDYNSLQSSASSGCPLCRLFIEAVKLYEGPHARSSKWSKEDPIILCSTKFDEQRITSKWQQIGAFRSREIPEDWGMVRLLLPIVKLNPASADAPGEHAYHRTHESQIIRRWAAKCKAEHASCADQIDFTPTRLIDVASTRASTVRLINTADTKPTDTRYLALSHCWGLTMPESARAVTSTVKKHQQEIHMGSLTQTFRDFIDIVRAVGVRYGWIDSLCIIQDSRDDWETEAAQMASVYSAAYLTIAASGSADGSEGCKVIDAQRSYGPIDLPVRDKASQDEPSQATTMQYRRFRIWTRSPTPVSIKSDPLTARGWTLQERELSTRLVHYSRDSIRWECSSLNASLEFPWHDRNAIGEERVFDPGDLSGVAFVPGKEAKWRGPDAQEDEEMNARAAWKNLVKRYTLRRLTYQADVLPALSGIAHAISEKTGDQYVAGLWKSYFLECLLWASDWHVSKGLNTHNRSLQYLAPTWSWASIHGPASYPSWVLGDRHSAVKGPDPYFAPQILSIDAEPAGVDAFGAVKFAKLRLRGRIKAGFTKHEQYSMSANQDRLAVLSPERDEHGGLSVQKIGEVRYDIPRCRDCIPDGTMTPIFILCCLHGDKFDDGHFLVFGLALKHASDIDPPGNMQTFRRVGLVWGMKPEFWHQGLITFTEMTMI